MTTGPVARAGPFEAAFHRSFEAHGINPGIGMLERKVNQMPEKVTVYSTVWCGYCRRLKRQLDENGVPYREIDIEEHSHHGDRIEEHTGGERTVPTVEVGGRLLVNPSLNQVLESLERSVPD